MGIQRTAGRQSFLLRIYRHTFFLCMIFSLATVQTAMAQPVQLSIKGALEKVQQHLPRLEAFRRRAAAAQQNIQQAKNTIVPELNIGYQVNMATFNNITGMSYPGFLLPVSGPPSLSNDMNFVPGSAAGALLKWNPLTFGQRAAAVEKAGAQFMQANAAYSQQLFEYQYAVITAYLEAVYCKQLMKVLQAAIGRNAAGLQQSLVLASTGLRPGIDTAQFQSAMAQAEIDLLQAESAWQKNMVEVRRLTVTTDADFILVLTDTVFNIPSGILPDTTAYNLSAHPYYQAAEAQKKVTAAGLKEIQKLWVPQLDVWSNLYARGSGVEANGGINKAGGFNLNRTNAGIGLQLSFPVLQYSAVNIKKKQYRQLLKADDAGLLQVQLDIQQQVANAIQQYRQDLKIAARTPVLLKTATDVYDGIKLGYEAGLIDYTRLAQSQYDLLKAAVSDANARLQVWRSLLAVSVARGNLDLFTDQLK